MWHECLEIVSFKWTFICFI